MQSSFSFDEYLKLHFQSRCLLVQLTLACPLECSHCCVSSGPDRKEKLGVEETRELISEFARSFGENSVVCLTGGEPFSNKTVLQEALRTCNQNNLFAYVITAAHWASSEERAKSTLVSLPKIDLLSVSVDHFHEMFVPLNYALNAVQAAQELGVSTNILYTHDDNFPQYEDIVRDALSLRGLRTDIHTTHLGASGRAKSSVPKFEKLDHSHIVEPCQLLGSPAVVANGNISLCCQVNETNKILQDKNHGLRAGNLQDNWVKSYNTLLSMTSFKALKYFGPKWIIEKLNDDGENIAYDPSESICESCSRLFRCRSKLENVELTLNQSRCKPLIDYACDLDLS